MTKEQRKPSISMMRHQASKLNDELDTSLAKFDLHELEALQTNQELKQLRSEPLAFLMERIDRRLALLRAVEAPPAPRGPAPEATPKIQVQHATPAATTPTMPIPLARGPVQLATPLVKPSIEPRPRTPEGRSSRPQVI